MKWTPKTWKSHVKTIQWNPSQQAVMETALKTNENIILEACAGSGKTTLSRWKTFCAIVNAN